MTTIKRMKVTPAHNRAVRLSKVKRSDYKVGDVLTPVADYTYQWSWGDGYTFEGGIQWEIVEITPNNIAWLKPLGSSLPDEWALPVEALPSLDGGVGRSRRIITARPRRHGKSTLTAGRRMSRNVKIKRWSPISYTEQMLAKVVNGEPFVVERVDGVNKTQISMNRWGEYVINVYDMEGNLTNSVTYRPDQIQPVVSYLNTFSDWQLVPTRSIKRNYPPKRSDYPYSAFIDVMTMDPALLADPMQNVWFTDVFGTEYYARLNADGSYEVSEHTAATIQTFLYTDFPSLQERMFSISDTWLITTKTVIPPIKAQRRQTSRLLARDLLKKGRVRHANKKTR